MERCDPASLTARQPKRPFPDDKVIGLVPKRNREAFEVRLRGGPDCRMLLLRLCFKQPDGTWMPMPETKCITIRADLLGAVLDVLTEAEAELRKEGLREP